MLHKTSVAVVAVTRSLLTLGEGLATKSGSQKDSREGTNPAFGTRRDKGKLSFNSTFQQLRDIQVSWIDRAPPSMTGSDPSPAKVVPTPNTMEFPESKKGFSNPADSPPGYFDVAPDSHIVFPPQYPKTEPEPSTAQSKQKTKGVYSHDPILDHNPDELWRFVVSNLRPPRLNVLLSGSHTETRTVSKSTGGTETQSTTVTDFSIRIDISNLVTPWSQLYAHTAGASIEQFGSQDAGKQTGPTVREALEEYTSSSSLFKEFRMRKLVLWDYGSITKSLTDLVRSTGYRNSIDVDFPMEDYKVVALASNGYSRSANSKVVRVLCCVSCLWIVFWPAWALARKRMKNRLTCEYRTRLSAEEFFSRNCAGIRSAVQRRVKGHLAAV